MVEPIGDGNEGGGWRGRVLLNSDHRIRSWCLDERGRSPSIPSTSKESSHTMFAGVFSGRDWQLCVNNEVVGGLEVDASLTPTVLSRLSSMEWVSGRNLVGRLSYVNIYEGPAVARSRSVRPLSMSMCFKCLLARQCLASGPGRPVLYHLQSSSFHRLACTMLPGAALAVLSLTPAQLPRLVAGG